VPIKADGLQAIRVRAEIGQALPVINPAVTEVMHRPRSSGLPQYSCCGISENQYTYFKEKKMAKKKFWLGMLVMALVFGMVVVGCFDIPQDDRKTTFDNTIYSVSISLGYGNVIPKVGSELSTSVENRNGYSVSGVSYQWKRADSQYSTFVNINDAVGSRYTPTVDDSNKYLKVEVKNSDTTAPVLSNIVGPVDANQVAKPTVEPAGGEVVVGQEITLTSIDENATIYYTLDGTTPTTSSTEYKYYSRLTITNNCTLKVIATRYDMVDSEVLSVSYTVVAAPSFSKVTSSASIFDGGIYSVAYGNNRFVAGGNSGRFAYSTNGTTWTNSTPSMGSSYIVQAITYGTQFVAVGYFGRIDYSSDGTSWNNVTNTTFGTSFINDVAYGGGRYVAVGEDGKMAYSTNGSTWTAVTDSAFGTSPIYGITYTAGKFIAVGASGKMAYSTTGTTWTAVTDSKFSTSIYGITYGGPLGKEKFVAVGGSYIAYSTDGMTWTRATSSYYNSGLFSRGLNRIAWGGNKFITVASAGVMLFSLDGINWAKIDGGTGTGKTQFDTDSLSTIEDIVYGNGRFLAVGSKSNGLLSVASSEMAISN
jgi:hypothetical protein